MTRDRPIPSPASRARWGGLALALLLAACGCSGGSTVDPPSPPLDTVEPLVARRIVESTEAVRDAPDSAAAWARLGEVYDLHDLTAEAVQCYRQAEQLDPTEWRWPYYLGILLRTSDRSASLASFTRAAELRSDYAPIEFYLAMGSLDAEELDRAEEHFSRALELDPEMANALLGLARVQVARGDPSTALELAERAARLAPTEAAVHIHLAQIHRALGDHDRADAAQRLAASSPRRVQAAGMGTLIDPVREELVLRVGASFEWLREKTALYLNQGRGEEALREWGEAIEADPASTVALVESARVLVALKRFDEARLRAERALELDPEEAAAHTILGDVLAATGDSPAAMAAYRRASELDPAQHEARTQLARLLLESGRVEEGIGMLQATVQARPDNADVRHNLALALLWAGRLGESVEAAREAMTINADHTQSRFLLRDAGRALWRQERFEEAIEAFRAAAEGSSERPALSRELAWALATCPREELRNGHEALVIARRLCERTRFSNPQELDLLAAAQAETGDFTGAVESARRAVTLAEQSLRGSPGAAVGDREPRVEAILRQLRARLALYESGRPYHQR